MPNLRYYGSEGGFEPGLTSLRVRHSTAEIPRSTNAQYVIVTMEYLQAFLSDLIHRCAVSHDDDMITQNYMVVVA